MTDPKSPTSQELASRLSNNTYADAVPSEIVTRLYTEDDDTSALLQAAYEQSGESVDLNQFRRSPNPNG